MVLLWVFGGVIRVTEANKRVWRGSSRNRITKCSCAGPNSSEQSKYRVVASMQKKTS